MMLFESPPCAQPTTTYSPHLSKTPISKDAPWRIFTLPTHHLRKGSRDDQDVPLHHIQSAEEDQHPTIGSPTEPMDMAKETQGTQLQDLPEEIQQSILNILIGNLRSTSSSMAQQNQSTRNWSNVMRHPRRRDLSDLALVSRSWRCMVQERLFRHIKIKGTTASLRECAEWFMQHSHLQNYVRHIEIWVPVWERRAGQKPPPVGLSGTMTFERHAQPHIIVTAVSTVSRQEQENLNQAYQLASNNATLEEIFHFVEVLFPFACILTLEGGHCKKPPLIQHFRQPQSTFPQQSLSVLKNIRTLVLKGAWNIMRESWHFDIMAAALPSLREWHCTYAKPKTNAYRTICTVLRHFPPTLTHLNICLEGFYSKDTPSTAKMRQLQLEHHLCRDLGAIVPQLEALTFTGRICACLFDTASRASLHTRKSRLRSVDLIVKNCCRDPSSASWNDGTGIRNWDFIQAFTCLTLSAVNSLRHFPDLSFLRIRFIDLDSPYPLLNPYFQLQHNMCSGIWTEQILEHLKQARPTALFAPEGEEEGSGMEGDGVLTKEGIGIGIGGRLGMGLGAGWPCARPKNFKVANYLHLAEGVGVQGLIIQ